MKHVSVLILICLAGCSWFGHKKLSGQPPSEYIVKGAPPESVILLDGAPQGDPAVKGKPQIVTAASGYHVVEVKVGDTVTYREQTYLAPGEHHFVQVLSAKN